MRYHIKLSYIGDLLALQQPIHCSHVGLLTLKLKWMLFVSTTEPSAPRNLTVIEIASTYVIISWSAPEFPNGVVRNYIVTVTERGGHFMQNTVIADTSANLTNLRPFVHYWLVVFAETIEIGDSSTNITFRTSEESKLLHLQLNSW